MQIKFTPRGQCKFYRKVTVATSFSGSGPDKDGIYTYPHPNVNSAGTPCAGPAYYKSWRSDSYAERVSAALRFITGCSISWYIHPNHIDIEFKKKKK